MIYSAPKTVTCSPVPRIEKASVVMFTWIILALLCACFPVWAEEDNPRLVLQLKWLHQFQFAGYYAALEKGYYHDAGLDVAVVERIEGLTVIDSLISGRAQFAVGDTGVLIYRANGVPLVALGAIFQHSPSVLLARKDAGINELADLKGKRVRLTTGYMNAELVSMLEKAGVDMFELDLMPGLLAQEQLINGQLDAINAYLTNEPRVLALNNVPFTVFHPKDYGVNFYGDVLFTTQGMIDNNPQQVKAFREASFKGWQYAVNHPEELVDVILQKYNSQNKSRQDLLFEAQELIKLIMVDVVPIGYMNQKRWSQIEAVFRNQGKIRTGVDFSRFIYQEKVDGSFARFLIQYRGQVILIMFASLALILVFHIFRLRSEVRLRTRDLRLAKELAEQEARTDVLTNLPNRRHFMKVLERDVSQAQRYGSGLVVMVVDIDFFKGVNDQYTHAAGDEALKIIALCLTDSLRNGDEVARLGGEEFAITCPNTSIAEAAMLAERLRNKVEQKRVHYQDKSFSMTISLGLAQHEEGLGASELLHNADLALYEAKKKGRNCVRIFEADNRRQAG